MRAPICMKQKLNDYMSSNEKLPKYMCYSKYAPLLRHLTCKFQNGSFRPSLMLLNTLWQRILQPCTWILFCIDRVQVFLKFESQNYDQTDRIWVKLHENVKYYVTSLRMLRFTWNKNQMILWVKIRKFLITYAIVNMHRYCAISYVNLIIGIMGSGLVLWLRLRTLNQEVPGSNPARGNFFFPIFHFYGIFYFHFLILFPFYACFMLIFAFLYFLRRKKFSSYIVSFVFFFTMLVRHAFSVNRFSEMAHHMIISFQHSIVSIE
jgi:hypothetical protein